MTAAPADEQAASPAGTGSGPRGRVWVCALAFGLLLVSTYLQFSGAIGTGGLTVVWSSIGLSAAAAAVAVAAVLLPGSRAQAQGVADEAEDEVPAPRAGPVTLRSDPESAGAPAEEPKPR